MGTGSQDGAVAQLGERLLCKQEVVGSIPSGSTNLVPSARAGGMWSRLKKPIAVPYGDPAFCDIVKRRLIRTHLHPGAACRKDHAAPNRRRVGSRLEKNKLVKIHLRSVPTRKRWASVMRVIKCLKSIRWMPWR